jgi:tetratricopeptide (TPR) repeat protein
VAHQRKGQKTRIEGIDSLHAVRRRAQALLKDGDTQAAYELLFAHAVALRGRGMTDGAQQILDLIRTTIPRAELRGARLAWLLHEEAFVQQTRGHRAVSRRKLKAMLRIAEAEQDDRLIGAAYVALSMLALAEGDANAAKEQAIRALEAYLRIDEIGGLIDSLVHTASIAIQSGAIDEAEPLLQALKASDASSNLAAKASIDHLTARIAVSRGEFVEAERLFRRALERERRIGDHYRIMVSLHNVGLVLLSQDRPSAAAGWLKKALGYAIQSRDLLHEGEMQETLAIAFARAGRLREALGPYKRAEQLARARRDRVVAMRVKADIGAVLVELGRVNEGRRLQSQALTFFRKQADVEWEARTLRNMAFALAREGRETEARATAEAALGLSSIGDWGSQAKSHRFIAESFLRDRASLKDAVDHLLAEQSALEIGASREERAWQALIAGALLKEYGHPAEAIQFYSRAVRLYARVRDPQYLFHSRNDRAIALMSTDDFPAARRDLRVCLEIAANNDDRVMEQRATYNLGEMYRRRNQNARALKLLNRALVLSRELLNGEGEADALIAMAMIEADLGDASAAARTYAEAEVKARAVGEDLIEARARGGLAHLAFSSREFGEAARLYQLAATSSRSDPGIHYIEHLGGRLISLAAGGERTQTIERAAQRLVTAAQAERQEESAAHSLVAAAGWIIPRRRELALSLYQAAIGIQAVANAVDLETETGILRFYSALMQPIMTMLVQRDIAGMDEGVVREAFRLVLEQVPNLEPHLEAVLDTALKTLATHQEKPLARDS